jgi:hypothetical protein
MLDERSKLLEASNLKLRNDLSSTGARLTAEQVKLQEALLATAKAQKDAADSQRKLNEFFTEQALPRHINADFEQALKALPGFKAEIWYRAEDPEAWYFAHDIAGLLMRSHWDTSGPVLIPASRFDGTDLPVFGVAIRNSRYGLFTNTPEALIMAPFAVGGDMRLAILGASVGAQQFVVDKSLPDDRVRIIVSARFVYR